MKTKNKTKIKMTEPTKNNSFEFWLESVGGNLANESTITTKSQGLRLLAQVVIVFLILMAIAFSLRLMENKVNHNQTTEINIQTARAADINNQLFDLPESVQEEIRSGYLRVNDYHETPVQEQDEEISLSFFLRRLLGIKTVRATEVFNPQYKAIKMIQSERGVIEMTAGSEKTIMVGFKNTGDKTWHIDGSVFVSLYASSPSDRISPFWQASWEKDGFYSRVAQLKTEKVRPGNIGFFTFQIRAPEQTGTYQETFKLAVENYCWIEGSDIELDIKVNPQPIQVVSYYSPLPFSVPVNQNISYPIASPTVVQALTMIQEPMIRVGLHSTPETVKITSLGHYTVQNLSGETMFNKAAGAVSTVIYDRVSNKYILEPDGVERVSLEPIRFIGQQKDQIFELTNYTRRLGDNNYNKYRGVIEFRYSPASGKVWLINEINMEDYLKGIDETSNASPEEFQKTLIVAARTYALHHYNKGTKHASDNFTVDALYDQIYRGVVAEQNHSTVTAAVAATRGQVVTYNNEPVITPYFSQSDGRTRDWQEVWGGGPYPWLVSVPDPYNQGKELLGHGVGLSAQGALKMASANNRNFGEILRYYYRGTEVQRIYN